VKPGDFYIGVLEFFAVLLPGSVLLGYLVNQPFFGSAIALFPLATETEQYAAFLLGAYALGHIVFLLASYLDEIAYRPLRKKIWADKPGDAYDLAGELRRRHVGGDQRLPMNTFKWCQAYLLQNAPTAAAEVRRYEADSKFFRSMTFLLLLLAGLLALQDDVIWAAISLLLSIACFGRYAEQRYKSTDAAYRHILILCTPNPFKPTKGEDKQT
jgi:hypothetical protein